MKTINKNAKSVCASLLSFALLMGIIGAGSTSADTWRYAHEEHNGDVQDVYAHAFKDYIENHSSHTLQIYRFGQLGESDDIMEQTQAGILDFVNQSPGFTGAHIPETQIFFIPYLMPTDLNRVVAFFRSSKSVQHSLPELYAEHDLELLSMYPEGEMVITIDEPFTSPEGLQGKKMRVMTNPLLSATYSAFGAIPTPLPTGQIYGALQTSMINGQENPIFWIESEGIHEVSPNLVYTSHGWFITAAMANKTFYDALPEKDKSLIQAAASHAFNKVAKHIEGLSDRVLKRIREGSDDITVTYLTQDQIQAFKARAPEVEQKFIEMTGQSGKDLLQQFKQDLQAASPLQ